MIRDFPKPANHPPDCRVCCGTGWQPGPDIKSKANGDDVVYTTVQPCVYTGWQWEDDRETDADGYNRRDPITKTEGKRIARNEYARECARNGRQPNWEWFNTIMAGPGATVTRWAPTICPTTTAPLVSTSPARCTTAS